MPHPRTSQRWLACAGLAPAPPGRRGPHRPRSAAPHEVWQVDAKDQLRRANRQLASWRRLSDECSGAFLATVVFPGVFNQVSAHQLRAVLLSSDGRGHVYATRYSVGRVNAGKKVLVPYDPQPGEWLFSDERGVLWCRHRAEQITAGRIRSLDLSIRPDEGGKPECPD